MARHAAAAPAPTTTGVPPTFAPLDEFADRVGLTQIEVEQAAARLGVQVYDLGTSRRLPPISQIALLHEAVLALRASARKPAATANAQTQLAELRTDLAALAGEVGAVRRGIDGLAVLFRQLLAAANAAHANGTPVKQERSDAAR